MSKPEPTYPILQVSDFRMGVDTDQQSVILNEMHVARQKLEEENQQLRDELEDARMMIRLLKLKLEQKIAKVSKVSSEDSTVHAGAPSRYWKALDWSAKHGVLLGKSKQRSRKEAFRNPAAPGQKTFEAKRQMAGQGSQNAIKEKRSARLVRSLSPKARNRAANLVRSLSPKATLEKSSDRSFPKSEEVPPATQLDARKVSLVDAKKESAGRDEKASAGTQKKVRKVPLVDAKKGSAGRDEKASAGKHKKVSGSRERRRSSRRDKRSGQVESKLGVMKEETQEEMTEMEKLATAVINGYSNDSIEEEAKPYDENTQNETLLYGGISYQTACCPE